MAFDADDLVPICQPIDIIPGSTFNWKTSFFMRLATPLEPILDNLHFESFAFFVAYRTIWENHERFHGAQDDPGDSISFTIPIVTRTSATGTPLGGLWDLFGLPPLAVPDDLPVSCLPFRAYVKIYNDWFRSATLQDSIPENTDNGPDIIQTTPAATYIPSQPFKRGKRFDYFTGALPAPQRGTAVSLPLGTSAPIYTAGANNESIGIFVAGDPVNIRVLDTAGGAGDDLTLDTGSVADDSMYADLSLALAPDVNDIRLAFATQHILERDA